MIRRTAKQFVWDQGNKTKNWLKHDVTPDESEQVFFDENRQEYPDPVHSSAETRSIVVGMTNNKRLLFIVYTERDNKIRIISARDISDRRERKLYEKTT